MVSKLLNNLKLKPCQISGEYDGASVSWKAENFNLLRLFLKANEITVLNFDKAQDIRLVEIAWISVEGQKLRLHFLAFDHVRTPPSLHFLCSKFSIFLTTYPPLKFAMNSVWKMTGGKLGIN